MTSLELLHQAIIRLEESLEDGLSSSETAELLEQTAKILRLLENALLRQSANLRQGGQRNEKEN